MFFAIVKKPRNKDPRMKFLAKLNAQFLIISYFILLHEKFLQFDWIRAVVFQLNLKYLRVKITKPLWVVI